MSKVFYTKFSVVSGKRFDPKYNNYIARYKVVLNNSVKLGSLLLKKPQYGANESAIDYNQNCRYIRITDIDEFGLLKDNGLKSAKHEEAQYKLEHNDLIIARSGATVGKSYLHQDKDLNAIFAGYMIRLKFDESKINPAYIFYYTQLDIYKRWTEAIQRSAGQPNINAEEYQDLDIPILSTETQNNVVALMEQAYQQKQQKEQEAKEKLESIDDYLLDALGIEVPKKHDVLVEDRVFFRKFSEVSGNRIDPLFYNHKFYIYEKLLKEKPFRKFKYFINSINNGFDFRDYQTSGTPYLKVANIKKGSFDFSKIQYINFDSSEIDKNIKLKKGNLLLTRKGTFGNALALDKDYNYVISSEIFYIELKKELINTDFLEIYFNSYMGQLQFDNNKIGAIMGSLSQGAIRELIIPTPSPNLQETIVAHITNLKNEAKALQEEASQIYNEAKTEVEKMILGERV